MNVVKAKERTDEFKEYYRTMRSLMHLYGFDIKEEAMYRVMMYQAFLLEKVLEKMDD